ncbi:MAG: hypothetical protein IRZ08_00590 [Frankia sp.]|nr:hypothetical protein [Frankia sp.]
MGSHTAGRHARAEGVRTVPPPPPFLPPGELDTLTGPISMSTSAARHLRPGSDPSEYDADHGYSTGYRQTSYHDLGDTGWGPAVDTEPTGWEFAAGYSAPYPYEPYPDDDVDDEVDQLFASRDGAGARRAGGAHRGPARVRGPRPQGGQRSPGAHRAPAGRAGSTRAKLAVAGTASLAGLSALVAGMALTNETGPIQVPGNGGGTSHVPAAQPAGGFGASRSTGQATPTAPQATPAPAPTASSTQTSYDDETGPAPAPSTTGELTIPESISAGFEIPVVPLTDQPGYPTTTSTTTSPGVSGTPSTQPTGGVPTTTPTGSQTPTPLPTQRPPTTSPTTSPSSGGGLGQIPIISLQPRTPTRPPLTMPFNPTPVPLEPITVTDPDPTPTATATPGAWH